MSSAELRDLLINWANINSGSGNLAGLDRMRAALAQEFGTLRDATLQHVALAGLPAEAGTYAQALRVRLRPSAPRQILLSGHYDTVYGADDPFQTCTLVDERTLRGPGVADMKGGIVVMLAALRAFERSPHAAKLGVEVLLTPDEETGSFGSAPLFEAAAQSKTFSLALVFEPARPNGDLVRSRKGTGNFVATCHGRAAHAASPIRAGRNAVVALAEFLVAAHRVPDEMPGVMLNVANIRGGGAATNVVPDFAEAQLDLRITQAADRAPLLARLHELAAPINAREGFRLELTGAFNRPPKECVPVEEIAFAAMQQSAREVGVAPFTWIHTGGASDGNNLSAAGLPNLDGLGPIGDKLHSADEFVNLPSIGQRAAMLTRFLEKFAAGEVALG
jgi:glutamate carboxypeptidase